MDQFEGTIKSSQSMNQPYEKAAEWTKIQRDNRRRLTFYSQFSAL